jgi:hypothetical protein
MIDLVGNNIERDFSGFTKIADLIYYDGPLLSHFISPQGESYLFYWTDVDDSYNRWMIVRVDTVSLRRYLERELSLKDIISNPNDDFVYFTDVDDEGRFSNVKYVSTKDIPKEYMPADDSMYDFQSNVADSQSMTQRDEKERLTLYLYRNREAVDTDEIESTGKFYSLNIKSGTYSFESTDDRCFQSFGHMDSSLRDKLSGISFGKEYNVKIKRSSSNHIGQKKLLEDSIFNFEEVGR